MKNKKINFDVHCDDKLCDNYIIKQCLYMKMKYNEEIVEKIIDYIRENYTNNNDLNDIWHHGFKDIYEICIGVDNGKE